MAASPSWSSSCWTRARTRTRPGPDSPPCTWRSCGATSAWSRRCSSHGADPNLPLKNWTPTRRTSKDLNFEPELVGATPLWLASRFTQPNVMRLLMQKGADLKFVHKSHRIVDGRGGKAYDDRYESITTLMAAVGMGGGGAPWVAPDRAAREGLILEAVKMAAGRGRGRQRREHRRPPRARRREGREARNSGGVPDRARGEAGSKGEETLGPEELSERGS